MAPSYDALGEESREGEGVLGERGVSTGLVHVSWARGWEEGGVDTVKQEVAACVPARGEHAPSCPLVGGGDDWQMGLVGCYRARPGQVSLGKLSVFLSFCSIFYYLLFATILQIQKNSKQCQIFSDHFYVAYGPFQKHTKIYERHLEIYSIY